MTDDSNQVKIYIFGQEYSVKAPADPEYIKKIAKYVDERMREVQSGFDTTQSSTRIAILAAMNITDELFNARQSGDIDFKAVEQKVSSLIELIDDKLQP
ncbi:MAG: cell division protein ZapA [Candidatus Marinimicrobia bacterium]|nr:cell division protein ZapA [Candidatus Neomarinimicrobiota bacterium]|tara:strand:- start:15 stop:311 length:297 start_codon:yes stop_codon:yes gene_type:complete